jgi:predicted alpha-1,2-mannosidase
MKLQILAFTAFSLYVGSAISPTLAAPKQPVENPLSYVDPNIGTAHSRWFFYTPAAVPIGMAKLAPSTNAHYGNPSGWEAVGYDARHNSIEGFVHFHEWQIGGVSVMPATGELKTKPGDLDKPGSGYRSAFDRKNEVAQPGYYKVLLDDYGITAELTATRRVGFHRYTFPRNERSRIILDIGNTQGESGEVRDASVSMVDDTHFEGFVKTYPKYLAQYDPQGTVSMYFFGEVSKAPKTVGAFTASDVTLSARSAKGKGAGLTLEYQTANQEAIEMKVGLSYTSTLNAKANFQKEAHNLSFDRAKRQAQAEWGRELGKMQVQGPDQASKTKFYTGLFHALLGRGTASDVDGSFPRHDGTIGRMPRGAKGRNFINTDAIWGGYWNLTQLWSLSYPQRYSDYVNTQLELYKERGWFGDGIANSNFASGVGTNFVGLAIAAAYQAGIRDFDTALAYQAIRANELSGLNRNVGSGKIDVEAFVRHGYVPFDDKSIASGGWNFSASHTLEYSFSAFAAAQMAKSLGNTEDYRRLIALSDGWRKLYSPELKVMQPKNTDGTFIDNFKPTEPWRGFQEGNAIQYSFFVPQNPAGLIQAVGRDEFNTRLNGIFEASQKDGFSGGKTIDAFAGVQSLYNHGNQPNLQASWLFNYSGSPWLTQKWTRAICNEFYGTEPIHGYGYGQDEDQGQLGSWYVMAALGLFDVKGLTDAQPTIQFGSPLFDRARIQLGNGKRLEIETKNNSAQNVYIQSAQFNGKPLMNSWLYRQDLMRGGRLVFTMGSQPNTNWGNLTPPPSAQ